MKLSSKDIIHRLLAHGAKMQGCEEITLSSIKSPSEEVMVKKIFNVFVMIFDTLDSIFQSPSWFVQFFSFCFAPIIWIDLFKSCVLTFKRS